jgi:hypothetical protein
MNVGGAIAQLRFLSTKVRSIDLNSERTFAAACLIAPLLCGLWSVARGVDANWDLLNYHLYNPFALLHGKLSVDLAPAGMQSYFNPILDLPYYLLNRHLFAPLVGFIMGAVHGLNFILLAELGRNVLTNVPTEDRYRIPLMIAIAGCLTPNFLSELGNTMGDNTTSLLILGSLLVIAGRWPRLFNSDWQAVAIVAGAGVLAGFAVGLKLTNGPYALALCLAFFATPVLWTTRLWLAAWFGMGVLGGVAATGGYWFFEMWRAFQNPLFPQFTSIFPNPLARSASILDSGWGPKGWVEALLWPFVFALDSHRVGQITIRQLVWPLVYVLFWIWILAVLMRTSANSARLTLDSRARFVVAFVAGGYLLWMLIFSVGRYLVPIELLTPLLLFILFSALLSYRLARRTWVVTIALATLLVVAGGYETWEHRGWAHPAIRAEVPFIAEPARSTALVGSEAFPLAWLVTQFPETVSFVHVRPFPTGPAYRERVREIIANRGGPVFAVLRGHWDERRQPSAAEHSRLTELGVTTSVTGCRILSWIAANFRTRKVVRANSRQRSDISVRSS